MPIQKCCRACNLSLCTYRSRWLFSLFSIVCMSRMQTGAKVHLNSQLRDFLYVMWTTQDQYILQKIDWERAISYSVLKNITLRARIALLTFWKLTTTELWLVGLWLSVLPKHLLQNLGEHLVCVQYEASSSLPVPNRLQGCALYPQAKVQVPAAQTKLEKNCWSKILVGKSNQNPTTLSHLILPVTSPENKLILKLNLSKLLVITFQVFILLREGGEENQAI